MDCRAHTWREESREAVCALWMREWWEVVRGRETWRVVRRHRLRRDKVEEAMRFGRGTSRRPLRV